MFQIDFVLLDWQSAGGNDPATMSAFAGKVVEDTYRTHLGLLRTLENRHDGKYRRMLALVFEEAECVSFSCIKLCYPSLYPMHPSEFKESQNGQGRSAVQNAQETTIGVMDLDNMESE